jgi:hypothetical protein
MKITVTMLNNTVKVKLTNTNLSAYGATEQSAKMNLKRVWQVNSHTIRPEYKLQAKKLMEEIN